MMNKKTKLEMSTEMSKLLEKQNDWRSTKAIIEQFTNLWWAWILSEGPIDFIAAPFYSFTIGCFRE